MEIKSLLPQSVDGLKQDQLEQLASRSGREKDVAQVKKLSRDFEAIFLEQMFRTMRSSIQKSGLIDGGNAEEIYTSMLDQEYAKQMSAQGSAGLADMIERQLLQTMGVNSGTSLNSHRRTGLADYRVNTPTTLRPEQKEYKIGVDPKISLPETK